jgi:polysaccharide deacetylase 2 family uncharacterized protein YibQ
VRIVIAWRPLEPTVKTALIFYLIFAGLLTVVTLWPPASRTAIGQLSDNKSATTISGTIELRLKQQDGKEKLQWISAESTIVLPATATKSQLIRLSSQWETLNHSFGFNINSTRWGYSNGFLRVKLNSSVRLVFGNRFINLPLEQLSLIQPVSEFKGKLPGLVPTFPPQVTPVILPKRLPLAVPKVPSIKKPGMEKPLHIKKQAKVAIIIDDVGFVTGPADAMLKIPAHLTWAILPDAPYTRKYTEAAIEHGFEILLHLPLEPLSSSNNPGPGLIKRDWSEEQIASQLDKDLAELPEAVGINNHMGSAGTSDGPFMEILMKEIKQHRIFFVDSLTIAGSVAEKYARSNKVPFAKRKVFIDNGSTLDSKEAALRNLMRIALRDGEAIGIAHVRIGTAQAIIEMLPEFVKAGIEIVPVSELVR